jgi:phospholipid transport system substrate-binding protein
LIEVMKSADALGYEGRFEKLAPVLGDVFDTSFMAEKSVGRYWKSAANAERAALLQTFTRFMIANYAGRFDGYSGQHFETLGQEEAIRGTTIVHTRLVEPDGDIVQLNYRLRPVEQGWRIIDVYLNGTVSELALRRSEYSSLIEREGFQALLAALDEKIAELAAGTAAPDPS